MYNEKMTDKSRCFIQSSTNVLFYFEAIKVRVWITCFFRDILGQEKKRRFHCDGTEELSGVQIDR